MLFNHSHRYGFVIRSIICALFFYSLFSGANVFAQPTYSTKRIYFADSLVTSFPSNYNQLYFSNFRPSIKAVISGSPTQYYRIQYFPVGAIQFSSGYFLTGFGQQFSTKVGATTTGDLLLGLNSDAASTRSITASSSSLNTNLELNARSGGGVGVGLIIANQTFKAVGGIYNDPAVPSNAVVNGVGMSTYSSAAGAFTWNMQTTASVAFAHHLSLTRVIHVNVLVCNNTNSTCYQFESANSVVSGYWSLDATNVTLNRPAGSFFNSASFTSANIYVSIFYLYP